MIKKVVAVTLLVAWSLVIFCFSADTGEKSGSLSGTVTNKIIEVLDLKLNKTQKNSIHTFVRKTDYFTEYFLLGWLIMNCCIVFDIKKYLLLTAITVGFLYAISDEVHQLFVAGRVGAPLDVLIDTCGVVTSSSIIYLIRSKHEKRR